jgi:hypothetical protein
LKVGLTKGSRGGWSQTDRFPKYERPACLSGETGKSWVLGKPPISSRLKAIMNS